MKVLTGRTRGNREGGVSFDGKRWRVRIMIDKKRISLGLFRSQEEAEAVYAQAYKAKSNQDLGFLRSHTLHPSDVEFKRGE